jgi:exopolysaccharide biosynthesis polyprenyl glycosylphosphotransferase
MGDISIERAFTGVSHEGSRAPIGPRGGIALRLTTVERKYLLLLIDLTLVNGSLLAAVTAWNGFSPSLPMLLAYWKWFVTLSVVWLLAGMVFDVYNLARSANTSAIMASAGLAALVVGLVYPWIPWLTPPLLHRVYALGFLVLLPLVIVVWRVLYAQVLARPSFRRRALILGADVPVSAVVDADSFHGIGYEIVGCVPCGAGSREGSVAGIPVLGSVTELVRLAPEYHIDEIIVAHDREQALPVEAHEALLDCRQLGLGVTVMEGVYERVGARLPVEYARRDLALLLGQADSPISRVYPALKRVMDLLLATMGLMIMATVLPAIALANALFCPGPLFYRQERVGKGGRLITVVKLRSMVPDAERETGAVWCGQDDPRITRLGRLLRKARLDELPQVINVLRGEMSVVGPRPERPQFVDQLSEALPVYRARHAVKPGLTGWAQVRYGYGNSVEDARIKLEYDLYYVKHVSLYLDLLILLQTVRVVLGFQGH